MNPTPIKSLVIRSPEDLLALVPCSLGFEAHHSVVMVTLAGPTPMHARINFPEHPADDPIVIQELIGAALRNDVAVIAVVVYVDPPEADLAHQLVEALDRAASRVGIELSFKLRVTGGRWFEMVPAQRAGGDPGSRYDPRSHRFFAESVLAGHVMHESREALADTLAPDPTRVAEVTAVLGDMPALGMVDDEVDRRREAERVGDEVARHVTSRTVPGPAEVGRLLRSLRHQPVIDQLVHRASREEAVEQAEFWVGVLRAAPPALTTAPAAMLALVAWLSGNGALAWCALDRAGGPGVAHDDDFDDDADEECPLVDMVADLLERAVPPREWRS